jgi:hypothetical protein
MHAHSAAAATPPATRLRQHCCVSWSGRCSVCELPLVASIATLHGPWLLRAERAGRCTCRSTAVCLSGSAGVLVLPLQRSAVCACMATCGQPAGNQTALCLRSLAAYKQGAPERYQLPHDAKCVTRTCWIQLIKGCQESLPLDLLQVPQIQQLLLQNDHTSLHGFAVLCYSCKYAIFLDFLAVACTA